MPDSLIDLCSIRFSNCPFLATSGGLLSVCALVRRSDKRVHGGDSFFLAILQVTGVVTFSELKKIKTKLQTKRYEHFHIFYFTSI